MTQEERALIEFYRKQALELSARADTSVTHNSNTDSANDNFSDLHPGRGRLRVQASTAQGSFPVAGAAVEVSRDFSAGKRVYFKTITDESGISDNMELPALPSDYSQNAETASRSGTEYQVEVFHPSYNGVTQTVTIYDKIETLLPVTLQPNGQ